MLGITDYLWRLAPANPILLRVVESGGKRKRDLFIRCGYLGLLVVVVCFSLATSSESIGSASLSILAQESARLFERLSYAQLALIALLSPIFTAGAITQERDSQTYDILLSTPLTNAQIVLGSLLSRMFFIMALLISGIPVFSITKIFGGVAIKGIAMSFAIAAATAFVTGATAMAIASFKVGTRRTIFSFYLVIVVYLVGVYFLDMLPAFHPAGMQISWLTGIHPFLALRVIFNDPTYRPWELARIPPNLRRWPIGWYLSSPQTFYIAFCFVLSFVLVMPSILVLRRVAQSTTSIKTWVLEKLHLASKDRTRKPRYVWANPIAWREGKTKASAARATLVRYSFILLGIAGAVMLAVLYSQEVVPTQYIDLPGGYARGDSGLATLTIYDNVHNTAKTYSLSNAVQATLNKNAFELSSGHGRYALESVGAMEATSDGGRMIASLNLKPFDRRLPVEQVRLWLMGLVIVEFAAILLIVTNAAASTVTREKEDGTLDLLLTSPITSRYYIWGKLRGLVSFVLPLVAVPVISVLIFIVCDIARLISGASADPTFNWVVFPEAVFILPATIILVSAFAAILGMHLSLRCRTTVWAVMSSVGIILGAVFGLSFCGLALLKSSGAGNSFSIALSSFSPFTLVSILIDPFQQAKSQFSLDPGADPHDIIFNRVVVFFSGWCAAAGYAGVVWMMYKAMVRNFDMTIRKQAR